MSLSINKINLLHCDDNPFEQERFAKALKESTLGVAYHYQSASSPAGLIEAFKKNPQTQMVVLDIDLNCENTSGIDLIAACKLHLPSAIIVMQSNLDDVETMVRCLSAGADDFLAKNYNSEELPARILAAFRMGCIKRGLYQDTSGGGPGKKNATPAYCGASMKIIAARVPQVIKSAVTSVHILGESGTGKEVVANIFADSIPSGTPFIRINCAAIAPTLLYGELFGHMRGAYTGANHDKAGILESADRGWVFLDEISNLSLDAQGALLRVLENKEIRRLGANTTKKIDVRVISACNENLATMVEEGRFRKDLWQRLCEAEFHLAPLRERPGEINDLVLHFCKTMQGGPYRIAKPALDILCQGSWEDGNIRELRNCLRAMTEFHVDGLLTPLGIPQRIWQQLGENKGDELDDRTPKKNGKENPAVVQIDLDESGLDFELLTSRLLLEVTKSEFLRRGKMTLRGLSKDINVSRSTLSTRLRSLVEKELISFDDLARMVSITDPGR